MTWPQAIEAMREGKRVVLKTELNGLECGLLTTLGGVVETYFCNTERLFNVPYSDVSEMLEWAFNATLSTDWEVVE
jgi:hypothetical protein